MTRYDYKVVPAPERGQKARGLKTSEARFAFALERLMNDMAAAGWEYQRAETLPSEERQGLSGKHVVYRNLLVFRRLREDEVEAYVPRLLDPPKEIPVLDAARLQNEAEGSAGNEAADGAPTDGASQAEAGESEGETPKS